MTEQKTSKHRPFRKFVSDEALEHARAAHKEMRKSAEALLPTGFVQHRRTARKEMLQAVRKVIDGALERIEEHESE